MGQPQTPYSCLPMITTAQAHLAQQHLAPANFSASLGLVVGESGWIPSLTSLSTPKLLYEKSMLRFLGSQGPVQEFGTMKGLRLLLGNSRQCRQRRSTLLRTHRDTENTSSVRQSVLALSSDQLSPLLSAIRQDDNAMSLITGPGSQGHIMRLG